MQLYPMKPEERKQRNFMQALSHHQSLQESSHYDSSNKFVNQPKPKTTDYSKYLVGKLKVFIRCIIFY